jgi:methionine synthase II (cobalamin-independent)
LGKNAIPDWVRNNAKWWSEGTISDNDFVQGIQYLIKNDIITVQKAAPRGPASSEIPGWIKNNAKWWSEGQISDSDFLNGIKYMIEKGIIKL